MRNRTYFKIFYEPTIDREYFKLTKKIIKLFMDRFIRIDYGIILEERMHVKLDIKKLIKEFFTSILKANQFVLFILDRKSINLITHRPFGAGFMRIIIICIRELSKRNYHKLIYHEIAESLGVRHCDKQSCFMFKPNYENSRRFENRHSFCRRCLKSLDMKFPASRN